MPSASLFSRTLLALYRAYKNAGLSPYNARTTFLLGRYEDGNIGPEKA